MAGGFGLGERGPNAGKPTVPSLRSCEHRPTLKGRVWAVSASRRRRVSHPLRARQLRTALVSRHTWRLPSGVVHDTCSAASGRDVDHRPSAVGTPVLATLTGAPDGCQVPRASQLLGGPFRRRYSRAPHAPAIAIATEAGIATTTYCGHVRDAIMATGDRYLATVAPLCSWRPSSVLPRRARPVADVHVDDPRSRKSYADEARAVRRFDARDPGRDVGRGTVEVLGIRGAPNGAVVRRASVAVDDPDRPVATNRSQYL